MRIIDVRVFGSASRAQALMAIASLLVACGSSSGPPSGVAASGAPGSGGVGPGGTGAGGIGTSGAGGASTGGVGGATTSGISKRQACIDYVNTECNAKNVNCGLPAEPDPCPQTAGRCPDFLFADGSTRTLEGTIACTQAFASQTCAEVFGGVLPACATRGTRPAGALCISGIQCASGSCADSACGTCTRIAQAGEACSDSQDIDCPAGMVCTNASCVVPAPAAFGKLGAPCVLGREYDCEWDLSCQASSTPGSAGPTCERIIDPNRCHLNEDCPSPEFCYMGSYCRNPLPLAGEPCPDGICGVGVQCDTTAVPAKCVPLPGAGEPCSPRVVGHTSRGSCAGDLWCVCTDTACASSVCKELIAEGGPCTATGPACEEGTSCKSGICVALDSLGLLEKCTSN